MPQSCSEGKGGYHNGEVEMRVRDLQEFAETRKGFKKLSEGRK